MTFLEELQHLVLLSWIICTDADKFKIAATIHAIHFYKFRKLSYTGPAPCGPYVDEPQLPRIIFDKIFYSWFINHLQIYRHFRPIFICLFVGCFFFSPLDRTAKHFGRCFSYLLLVE